MKTEGQGVDALRWSKEKMFPYRSQLVAVSNANEVLLCVLYLCLKPGLAQFQFSICRGQCLSHSGSLNLGNVLLLVLGVTVQLWFFVNKLRGAQGWTQ